MDGESEGFQKSFSSMMGYVHSLARAKGWWSPDPGLPTTLVMVHAEVSEMVEAVRDGNPESGKIPGFSAAEEEAADVVIRMMDLCESRGFRLGDAILAKHRYNMSRTLRHGGKPF